MSGGSTNQLNGEKFSDGYTNKTITGISYKKPIVTRKHKRMGRRVGRKVFYSHGTKHSDDCN